MSWTEYKDLTLTQYDAHLRADGPGLGIIMLLDDCNVVFGVIDHDDRAMDHVAFDKLIRTLDLPLVMCRSKSGGGHFYLFLAEPTDPVLVRDRLVEYGALLRLPPATEIFPKQTQRVDDADVGSWINLPYYAGLTDMEPHRPAMINEEWVGLVPFLDYAESKRVADVSGHSILPVPTSAQFIDGPPCLQFFEAEGGFPSGSKKNGMFSVGVYLQKVDPDGWEDQMEGYNQRMAQLTAPELVQLTKSLGKKSYQYKCNDQPLSSVCQKGLCKRRKYGVGGDLPGSHSASSYEITDVTKYEVEGGDPIWVLELNGTRIQFTHADFYDVNRFNMKCLASADIVPAKVNQARWKEYAEELAQRASKVPSPNEASATGQTWALINAFLDEAPRTSERIGLVTGKTLLEAGRIHFRSPDLYRYLREQRIPLGSEHEMWLLLRRRDGDHGRWNVRGRFISYWSLPYEMIEDPEDDVVDLQAKETF